MKNTFYITTPIYYVNDKPHIGHAYTTILADVLSRYHRNSGQETFFLTGLDEHGQKVQQAAEKRGVNAQQHCDEMAPRFSELWKQLHISNDDFIRTTEERHKKVVQNILQEVMDKGDIYEAEYEGLYSISEERFITEKESESGEFRDIKKLKEKNYFFKMSKYQQALINHIEKNPNFIQPNHRKNEILGFLRQPLNDLCISRPKSRLNWGIELPFDSNYVTYVWFDALINYITAAGFGSDDNAFKKWWPASYHLIGKDILWFHTVIWHSMLLSAGLKLPKCVFAHGWWTFNKEKISKSRGKIINVNELISIAGVDASRYFLLRETPFGDDGDFSEKALVRRYNDELADKLGNLVSRVSGLIEKNGIAKCENKLLKKLNEKKIDKLIEEYKFDKALNEIFAFVDVCNEYVQNKKPWETKDKKILFELKESISKIGELLLPFIPESADKIIKQFNLKKIKKREILFKKIE